VNRRNNKGTIGLVDVYTPSFHKFALFCLAVNYLVFLKPSHPVRMATATI